jgi:hypothetical protein
LATIADVKMSVTHHIPLERLCGDGTPAPESPRVQDEELVAMVAAMLRHAIDWFIQVEARVGRVFVVWYWVGRRESTIAVVAAPGAWGRYADAVRGFQEAKAQRGRGTREWYERCVEAGQRIISPLAGLGLHWREVALVRNWMVWSISETDQEGPWRWR